MWARTFRDRTSNRRECLSYGSGSGNKTKNYSNEMASEECDEYEGGSRDDFVRGIHYKMLSILLHELCGV